jgi:peptidoglycan/xylan/chitin deacetylase (PgdA/CDA1 family)
MVDRLVRYTPAQAWFRHRAANRLAVLAYHGINDPAAFARQMAFLADNYQTVDLDAALSHLSGENRLRCPVLVTFDDCYRSVFDHALPILNARRIPAVAFVVPGVIGTTTPFWWDSVRTMAGQDEVTHLKTVPDGERRATIARLESRWGAPPQFDQLSWDEVRALEAGGIRVENHTLTHPLLDRCPEDVLRAEVEQAHLMLQRELGRSPVAFAYPNGNHDPRAEAILRELGYRAAFLFDHRLAAGSDLMRICRLRVNSDASVDHLAVILSGLQPAILRARGRT